jgi:Rod binding domain-containing protein
MQIAGVSAEIVAQQAGGGPSPRLVKAAHEFEGQMMKELLKPMMAGGDDGDDGADGSGGALGEFASEALGQGLSQQGGFGIADRIIKELSHSRKVGHAGKVIGNPQG